MSFVKYVIILAVLAYILPGLAAAVGVTGVLWGEGFSLVSRWSLYSLESAAALTLIAAIHLSLAKVSLSTLIRPVLILAMAVIIIPFSKGFISHPDGLNTAPQSAGPLNNVSLFAGGIADILVRHGTGVLGIAASVYVIWVIINNKPQRGILSKFLKN